MVWCSPRVWRGIFIAELLAFDTHILSSHCELQSLQIRHPKLLVSKAKAPFRLAGCTKRCPNLTVNFLTELDVYVYHAWLLVSGAEPSPRRTLDIELWLRGTSVMLTLLVDHVHHINPFVLDTVLST